MTCSTKKRGWDRQEEAREQLRRILDAPSTALKRPVDVYRCGKCGQYHLTAQQRRRP